MRAPRLPPRPCSAVTGPRAALLQRISGTAEAAMIGFLAGQMCLSAVLPAPEARAAAAPPGPANDAALCRAAIATAEAQTRIPDEFLSAIGRVESGRPLPGAGLTPWPWTINAAGTGHFYASRQDAIAAARGFLASGVKSIDVGCLQVNLMYHPEAFVSLNEAFDPAANAAYAARLLLSLFQQQRSWPRAAAAYHSETPALGQAYQQKVLAAWAEPEGGPAPAATPLLPPFLHAAEKPQAAMPATSSGSVAGAPVAGFQRSFRLPGAAAPLPTGRLLAAYRAFPVRLAAGPPVFAPRVIK